MKKILLTILVLIIIITLGCKKEDNNIEPINNIKSTYCWTCRVSWTNLINIGLDGGYYTPNYCDKTETEIRLIEKDSTYIYYEGNNPWYNVTMKCNKQ